VIAVGDAGDALVAKLRTKAEEIKVGPGRDAASDMGPVVNAGGQGPHHRLRRPRSGGGGHARCRRPRADRAGPRKRLLRRPTLFDRVTTDMDIYTDEIFGPVLVVLRAAASLRPSTSSTPTSTATAPRSSPRAARPRGKFQRDVQVG